MTEHVVRSELDTEELPEEARAKMEALVERLQGLTTEKKHLFVDAALAKILKALHVAIDSNDDAGKRVKMIGFSINALNFVGLANASISEEHEEWIATGYKDVDDLWDDLVEEVWDFTKAVTVSADDLSEDVLRRVASGEPTEDDLAKVKEAFEKTTGYQIPDDIDVDVVVKAAAAKAKAKAKAEHEQEQEGFGLYL